MFSVDVVDARGEVGDAADRARRERHVEVLGAEQRHVLLDQRVARLGQDADEVVPGQRLELDANREPALQLGDQVRRLRDVKRAGGDEQDVIGLHHPVLRVDRRPLDDRQDVALHAFAADVGPVTAAGAVAAGDLVDLVDEDDARPARRAGPRSGRPTPCRRSLACSSATSCSSASRHLQRRVFARLPNMLPIMSFRLTPISSTECRR